MVLQKQPITFRFGPVDQDIGSKHVRPGQLVTLENARQLQKHDYRHRRGYGRTAFSAASSSWRSAPDSLVYTDTRLMLDGFGSTLGGQAWAFDTVSSNWRLQGSLIRPFTTSSVLLQADAFCQPQLIRAGGNDWTFVRRLNGLYYRVTDSVSGREIVAKTSLSQTGLRKIVAVNDGTNIWVFGVLNTSSVALYKFVVATPTTSAVLTTYQTIATAELDDVDAHLYADGQIFVVVSGVNAANYHYSHSVLDKTTGQAAAAPAPVTTTAAGTTVCHVSVLVSDGSSGFAYYAVLRPSTELRVVKVTRSTNAISILSATAFSGVTFDVPAGCNGYVTGDIPTVFATTASTGVVASDIGGVNRYVATSNALAAWTTTTLGLNCWLHSKPFQFNGTWYMTTGSTSPGQSCYHLRAADASAGKVLSQIEFGLGPKHFDDGENIILTAVAHSNYPAIVESNVVWLAGMSEGHAVRFRVNFAETYGPGVALRNAMLVPGPVPMVYSGRMKPRELTPLQFPTEQTEYNTDTPDDVTVQVVYRLTDADGNIDRSAPGHVIYFDEATEFPATRNIRTLRHYVGDIKAQIEIYMTDPGSTTPVLRYVRENDPTVNNISVTLSRTNYDSVDPEAIYTTGGALSAFPAPPCRNVAVHRNRVILSGTPRLGQIQPSLEMEDKRGPRFSPILASFWRDISTDILRVEPVNWNEVAVFTADRVGVFTGNGPNGKGAGVYTVQTLPAKVGLANERAAVNGLAGCYYQGRDLRYYLVSGGAIKDVGVSVETYTSPASTALHNPDERYIQFFLQDGKILCLDYGRPTDEQQYGQWSVWFSSGLTRAYAAAMIGSSPEHVEIDGGRKAYQSAFTDTNSSSVEIGYDMKLVSGDLAVFDLGGEFAVDEAIVHGDFVSTCFMDLTLSFDRGLAAPTTFFESRTITSAPLQRMFKPTGALRVQSVKFTLTLTSGVFNGMTFVVKNRGKTKFSNSGQRVLG